MRRRPPKAPDDDALLHQARRATIEAGRLRPAQGGPPPTGKAPRLADGASERVVLATMADLAALLRRLIAERNRLGAQLETIDRQSKAVTAYRTTSGLRTLPPQAKRF
ncbi:MAG: hypothetical protein HXX10_21610 [Rhodoplanes sp.]|uniref:hypothetical protein n=1 Tax=Rhodoplanes sp. TaxID=1968906 RepID=UPI0017AC9B70|nr:hypothetical protein [Rhodoplanes sp.]NVO16631.1 hypothetical protein [Rhodoplanes sp.]